MAYLAAPDVYEEPDADLVQSLTLVRAAKWAGVRPWELAEKPAIWLDLILLAQDAEQQVIRNANQRRETASNHRG